MRYSIEGQELTDIADALRARYGETKLIDANEAIHTMSAPLHVENNVSGKPFGFDHLSGSDGNNACDVITSQYAERIHVRIKYNLNGRSENPAEQYIKIATGDWKDNSSNYFNSDKMPDNSILITGIGEQEFWFDADTVTIFYGMDKWNLPAGEYGYYAECSLYGKVEVLNTYTSAEMAGAINNLPPSPPDEAFLLTGNIQYRFSQGGWDWFLEQNKDRIITRDISYALNAFQGSKLAEIPFVINAAQNTAKFNKAFNEMPNLTTVPIIKLNLTNPSVDAADFTHVIASCPRLRDAENLLNPDELEVLSNVKVTSAYTCPKYNSIFSSCWSLREVPSWWYKFRFSEESTAHPSSSYCIYYNPFQTCYSLNKVNNFPIVSVKAPVTSNMFSYTFNNCSRLNNATFEVNEDGTPKVVQWKTQTIDMSAATGYLSSASNKTYILNYNSGITADKEVKDDATYQALKDDPDWWTSNIAYSRYNHDSAVATINSLPDASAYLATAGGTNTIKFKKAAGSLTDGGAIETLTAEEIAVATAKGWTVSLV